MHESLVISPVGKEMEKETRYLLGRLAGLAALAFTMLLPSQEPLEGQSQPTKLLKVEAKKLDLPRTSIDEEVSVAVVFPGDFSAGNPKWYRYAFGFAWSKIDRMLEINMASPLRTGLTQIFGRLFPSTSFLDESADSASYALKVVPRFAAEAYTTENRYTLTTAAGETPIRSSSLVSLKASLTLELYSHDGSLLGKIPASVHEKSIPGKLAGMFLADSAEKISKRTASQVASQLLALMVVQLKENSLLLDALADLAVQRARPCKLLLSASLADPGPFENGRLDALEEANLVVGIENVGEGPAYGVEIRLEADKQALTLDLGRVSKIERIEPKERVELLVPVKGARRLVTGLSHIDLSVREKRGFEPPPLKLALATSALETPRLEILELRVIEEPSGRDVDSVGSGREYILASTLRNSGAGSTDYVQVEVTLGSGERMVFRRSREIPPMATGHAESFRFPVKVPRDFIADQLLLEVSAVDKRGDAIGHAYRAEQLAFKTYSPKLELAWKLYDNGRGGSKGDGDGVLSNGETASLEIRIGNKGELAAKGVGLLVEPLEEGLSVRQREFTLGEILPGQTSSLAEVQVLGTRRMRLEDYDQGAVVEVTMLQEGYDSTKRKLFLPVERRVPDLRATLEPVTMAQGAQGTAVVLVENEGRLAAEDVVVSIVAADDGVGVLDEGGRFVRQLSFSLDAISPGSGPRALRVPIMARGNAEVGRHNLRADFAQADFPVSSILLSVAIEAAEVPTVEIGEHILSGPAGEESSSPVVSFRNADEGQVFSFAELVLEIDVFSERRLATAVLFQNKKDVGIPRGARWQRPGGDGYRLRIPLRLVEGENQLSTTVVMEDGATGDAEVSVLYIPAAKGGGVGRYWVGVSDQELREILENGTIRINGEEARALSSGAEVEIINLGTGEGLREGLNEVEGRVAGIVRKVRVYLEEMRLAKFEEPYRESYAVVVAIDDYERKRDKGGLGPTGYRELGWMRARAQELVRVLQEVGFPKENIFTLFDEDAESGAIADVLKEFWVGGKFAGADRLFFYFGGHGGTAGGVGYLVTYDFDPERPTASSFLLSSILHQQFPALDVHHALFALDSCSSGLAAPGSRALGSDVDVESVQRARRLALIKADTENRARNLLVAGTGDEDALYENGGIFTEALIEALRGSADLDGDGILQLPELEVFVRSRVVQRAAETGRQQRPMSYSADRLGDGRVLFLLEDR